MLPNKYFTEEELTGGGKNSPVFHDNFLYELYALRVAFDLSMVITSGARDPEYNKSVGGHPRSLHLTDNPVHPTNGCMAVDVDITRYREDDVESLIEIAWDTRWSIGIAKTFIHLDRRVDIGLPQHKYYY